MRASLVTAAVATLALGLGGCAVESGDRSDTFPSDPLATIHSDGGLTIDVWTAPEQPPARGESSVELAVRDGSATLDGLDVAAVPWMPAMGHGSSVVPQISAEGDGRYRIDDVELFMPGEWELRLTFSGKMNDRASARFQIH